MAVRVDSPKNKLLTSAAALALALPLWAGAVLAQEGEDAAQDTQAPAEGSEPTQQTGDTGQTADGQSQGEAEAPDVLIATINDAEIRNSDLMRAIGALPPQLSAQPPEIVAATALEQLFLREAIVQKARSQGLAEDPDVLALVQGATEAAEEDALVQVWLQRELATRVTPEAVDAAYAGIQAVAGEQPVPPLDQIRPQIRQNLAQQAILAIESALLTDADVVLFAPDGQPLDQQGDASGGTGNNADASTGAPGADTPDAGQDQSQDNAADGEAASGDQSSTDEPSSDD